MNTAFNFYSGWTMITPQNADGWAQSGFNNDQGEKAQTYFAQYAEAAHLGEVSNIFYGPAVPANHVNRYWEQYSPANEWIYMNVDSTQLAHTNFNPFASAWQSPFRPEFYDEVGFPQNSMPGTSANPVLFNSIQTQDIATDVFGSYNTSYLTHDVDTNNSNWRAAVVNSSEVKAWTQ